MRSSASLSSGRVRSIRSPLVLATSAASASRGLMDLATSSAVVPLGTSFVLPSGSLMWMLSAMGCFRVYHRPRSGGCPHPDLSDDNVYVSPDAPLPAGERRPPGSAECLSPNLPSLVPPGGWGRPPLRP